MKDYVYKTLVTRVISSTSMSYEKNILERLQYDCLDLSDNEVRKLDGFPHLRRLKTLLLNNNRNSSFNQI